MTVKATWVALAACLAASGAMAGESAACGVATGQAQQAVERGIAYLQRESASWMSTRKCAACHHAAMPLWALGEAERMGYAIDTAYVTGTFASVLGSHEKMMAAGLVPDPSKPLDTRPSARGLNMGLPFMAFAAQSLPLSEAQRQSMAEIAEEIVAKQQPDGSWEFFDTLRRPPINESQVTDAAWILLALDAALRTQANDAGRSALERGIAWLKSAPVTELPQEKGLKLLVGLRLGWPRAALQPDIDALLARERDDGGWSQLPELASDAFATGQALYVLSLAGYTQEQPAVRRGVEYLIAAQAEDGSWPMISRSTPDGRPGGATLLTPITCSAASWAVLGLSHCVPKE